MNSYEIRAAKERLLKNGYGMWQINGFTRWLRGVPTRKRRTIANKVWDLH